MFNKLTFAEKATSSAGFARISIPKILTKKIGRFVTKSKGLKLPNKPIFSLAENEIHRLITDDATITQANKKPIAKGVKTTTTKNDLGKKTFNINDSTWYKMGTHTLAMVASGTGLATNIMAAKEILNPKTNDEKFGNGDKSYSDYYQNYGSQQKREQSYAITANKMLPYLNLKASAAHSSIRFGAPMFYY